MGKVSDFFRPVRFDYLGAADRDWIQRTAKYYNITNPPTLPLDYSRIRARENILIAQFYNENQQYVKNAYSISYLKSIPQNIVAGLAGARRTDTMSVPGLVGGYVDVPPETDEEYYAKFQTEMGRIVNQALFSLLNETDQSLWYEWLLRMDRGAANDRDMFLGVFDRGSVIDFAKVVNVVGAAAIVGYVGWSFAAAAAGTGGAAAATAGTEAVGATAGGVTASTELAAAASTAAEGGGLLGGTGLLTGGGTVAAESSLSLGASGAITAAGAAATSAAPAGVSGIAGLTGLLGGSTALETAGAALVPALVKEAENLIKGGKNQTQETVAQSSVNNAAKPSNVGFAVGVVSALTAIYYLSI